jgi:hypothetical protein
MTALWTISVSRHRTIMNIFDKTPHVHKDAFVAPSASLIGDVQVGPGASIWYGCVLRGLWILSQWASFWLFYTKRKEELIGGYFYTLRISILYSSAHIQLSTLVKKLSLYISRQLLVAKKPIIFYNCDIDEYAMLMLDSNFCCIQWDLLLIQQFGHMHMLFNLVFYLNRAGSEVGICQ